MSEENKQSSVNKESAKEAPPVDKHPQITALRNELTKERKSITDKSAAARGQREELLKKIQPLEIKLREVDAEIAKIERPRLSEIDVQLGKLAVATGAKTMSAAG